MARRKTTAPARPYGDKAVPTDKCGVFSVDEERVRRGRAALPPDEQAQDIADIFKMLAHPTRVKLIRGLASGEMCVCEISEVVGLSVSATSHQLHQLRDLRLVRSRSEGKLVHYSLQAPFLVSLLEDCAHHVSDHGARV
ncbi:MAG TPA: metalloregulator ArsR/SmtB family transcription factor [Myxococcota bacterium]|nr:metalloregulator ArsR/SmtB family transcription factor [Myxococcota bacterium]